MKEITYVTGNWAKIASAKQTLEPLGFKINNIKKQTLVVCLFYIIKSFFNKLIGNY